MQVTTERYINDNESVHLGATKIVNDYNKVISEIDSKEYHGGFWAIRRETIKHYNHDNEYIQEVDKLYDEIVNAYYPNEKPNWDFDNKKIRELLESKSKTEKSKDV